MKRLSNDSLNRSYGLICENARPLEKFIFENYFFGSDISKILSELKKFQNEDGGFGNGFESDYRLPLSSPLATYNAFSYLEKYDSNEKAIEIIKLGIKYFESIFLSERNGWMAVPREVNDYPHAPWWHYIEKDGMTIVDRNWGNPTAGIIAYLYKYRDFVSTLNVEKLLDLAIDYFMGKDVFQAESEVYSFINLYKSIPNNLSEQIEDKLTTAVQQVICNDVDKWNEYVPKPLDFVNEPKSNRFGISHELIEYNLNYLIDTIESNGKIDPPWDWHALKSIIDPNWNWDDYNLEWEKAKKEWIGVLTMKALITLDKFDRIEKSK